ncbi:unnamed protein product [Coregonus sp. 'balchen']|nr:unnamed protein product [Coregonus sp. 'balchen']
MKSDVEELMPRLLPVETCDTGEDFKLNEPPRNPQEYLRQVQLEASLCPDVVVAKIDPKKLRKKQSVNVSLTGCQAAPQGFSPSLKWQRQQVSNFSEIRQPKQDSEEQWKKFCLGENVYLNSPPIDPVSAVLEYLINWFEEREFVPQLESQEDERLSPLNLMICLVARYFDQNDLADKED